MPASGRFASEGGTMALDIVRVGFRRPGGGDPGRRPGARFLGGGTLAVRDYNSGDGSIRRSCSPTGSASTESRIDGGTVDDRRRRDDGEDRRASGPRLPAPRRRVDRRPGGARHGDRRRQSLRAGCPYGDFAVALLALGATVSVEDARRRARPPISKPSSPSGAKRARASCARSRSRARRGHLPLRQGHRAASRTAPRSCRSRRCCRWPTARSPARASPMARWRRRRCAPRAVERRSKARRSMPRPSPRRSRSRPRARSPLTDPQASDWYRRERAAGASRPPAVGVEASRWRAFRCHFTVNGAEQAEFVEPGALLVDVLRDKLGLTATKVGCDQGTCGACTVIDRRRAAALLPDSRRSACEGTSVDDAGGHRRRRRAPSAAARLRRWLRRAMRLLHAGHDHRRQGAARPQSRARPRRRGRRDLRQYLPLHRLRADHRRDPRRRGGDARRAEDRHEGDARWNTSSEFFADERAGGLQRPSASASRAPTRTATSPAAPSSTPTAAFPACCI